MAECAQENRVSERRGCRGWRWRIAAALLLVLAIPIILYLAGERQEQSAENHLAAVNARRALPPEQNAATIYDQLAARSTLTGEPPSLTPDALAGLIEASRIESCWFPLSPGQQCYMNHLRHMYPMREWARALAHAAKQDIASGDIEVAAQKLRCLVRMGSHLRQQPLLMDFMVGTAIEGLAWSSLGEFVMGPAASEELLRMAETVPWGLENDYKEVSELLLEVVPLIAETVLAEWTLPQRVRIRWLTRGQKSERQITEELYLRLLSQRRGARLLLGLRRYHDASGRWPDSLDEIKTLVPAQALIDPYTEQRFMYRTEAGEFLLYSKGPNRRDDNGQHHEKADDYQIWLPRRMTSPQPIDREAQ